MARRALLQQLEAARPQCVTHPGFLASLGGLWLEEGEPSQALIWLERALLLDPGHLGAQADLALALAAMGQPVAVESLIREWRHRTDVPLPLRQRLLASKGYVVLKTQDGLFSNPVFSMAPGPDGSLWVGSFGGVSHLAAVR